ncbi:MAG: hypothetical protein MJB14_02425 [Spirochaetes bacterium]|nr:hypothetical protein [Spirochaetota bacterium]
MKKTIILLIITCCLFSCSKENKDVTSIVYGISSNDFFYSNESYIDQQIIKQKIFKTNHLDFWLFGTDNKKKSNFFHSTLKSLTKKKNGNSIIIQPLYHPDLANHSEITPLFFTQKINFNQNPTLPVILRDLKTTVLYNGLTQKYDSNINYYLNEYFTLLDRGYYLALIASAEIIGPHWNMDNLIKIGIITDSKKTESIQKALENRQTFISTEANTKLNFQINQQSIGSIIQNDAEDFHMTFKVENQTTAIKKIEIITNNGIQIYHKDQINTNQFDHQLQLKQVNPFQYFCLKVTFNNNGFALTSPIWIIKEQKILLHRLNHKKHYQINDENYYDISFTLENISNAKIHKAKVLIQEKKAGQLYYEEIDLKIREKRKIHFQYFYQGSDQYKITIKIIKDNYELEEKINFRDQGNRKKIFFDGSHNNMFANNYHKLFAALEKNQYSPYLIKDIAFFEEYENLEKCEIIVITAPAGFYQTDESYNIYYHLARYVYLFGGNILLGGYYNQQDHVTIDFLNNILYQFRTPNLTIQYRVDRSHNIYPIYDEKENFGQNNLPLFKTFDTDIIPPQKISKIYLRNPIEFYAIYAGKEIPFHQLYKGKNIVRFSETTSINRRTIYHHEKLSAAAAYKYGKGKVMILGGINFSDYDIDNLDNKEFFLNLLDYFFVHEETLMKDESSDN